jgi:SagB-type dehydrogenase family enzyme
MMSLACALALTFSLSVLSNGAASDPEDRPQQADSGEVTSMSKASGGEGRISLPAGVSGELTVEAAIAARRSVRSFAPLPLSLPQVARLLAAAYGVTRRGADIDHHSVPSAGGIYPMEIYLVAAEVDSLSPGLYHFHPADTSLSLVRGGNLNESLHHAANEQEVVGLSPAAIIIAARLGATAARDGARAERYVCMEAGEICQNIYLEAAALGLGTCAVGAFDDDAANRAVGVDGTHEVVLLIMPVGVPAAR